MSTPKQPEILLIENKGPNTLLRALGPYLTSATQVSIASAFVTENGIRAFLPGLRKVARRQGVRVITGFYGFVTEPKALTALLKAQDEPTGKLFVRISRDNGYHRKLFVIQTQQVARVFIGSSNLTSKGLTNSGELTVCLTLPLSHKASRSFRTAFEFDNSQRQSVPLTGPLIKAYEVEWKKHHRPIPKPTGASLKKILARGKGPPPPPPDPPSFWREHVYSVLGTESQNIVEAQTDWERKGWTFFTGRDLERSKARDRALVLDHNVGRAHLIVLKDVTEIPTDDGRYHRAYLPLTGYRTKRLNRNLKKRLNEIGALPSRASQYRHGNLSQTAWRDVLLLFKKPRSRKK